MKLSEKLSNHSQTNKDILNNWKRKIAELNFHK